MKNLSKVLGLSLMALFFVVGVGAGSAHAATLNVPGDYSTIQAAVTAATGSDTVTVDAGTYAENVTIASGKDGLTLTGHSSADTIISVADGTFGIKVQSASVHISGFWITAVTPTYAVSCAPNCGIWFAASGTSGSHTLIHDNKIEGFYDAVGSSGGVAYWNIYDNVFNNNRTGVFFNTSTNMLVDGNTFSNYFAGTGGTESTTGITISNNTFLGDDGSLDSDLSAFLGSVEAVGMTDDAGITITGNTFSGANDFGIQVYDNGGGGTAVISSNSISGTSTFGLKNNSGGGGAVVITATNNWWGDASGPGGSGPGTGDNVSTNVVFSPWCTNSGCTTFGPVEGVSGTTHTGFTTIQAAVTAASAGDTINVVAGTYAENVTIPAGKDGLVLAGHSSADTIISVANGTFGIKVQSASVDISGFHITATAPSYAVSCAPNCGIWFAASGTSGAHTKIHNNLIEGFYDAVGSSGGVAYWDIQNNTFNNNRTGVFFNTSTNMLVSGNTFTNYFAGTGGTESTSYITIYGNNFSGNNGSLDADLSGFSTIVEAIGMTNDVTNLYIMSNIISGTNIFGIQVYANGVHATVDAHIMNNSITVPVSASSYGLIVNPASAVTAENNWWGDADGPCPTASQPACTGLGSKVTTANLDFTPFYTADITPLTFQIDTPVTVGTADLTIDAGSKASSVGVGSSSLAIETPASSNFVLRSADSFVLDNDQGLDTGCDGTNGTLLSFSGVFSVVVTPDVLHTTTCTHVGGGGGGGSGGGSSHVPPPNTDNAPGCSGGNLFNTSTGQSCVNNTVIPGCGDRTTGFSASSGLSCAGNKGESSSGNPGGGHGPYNFGLFTLRNGSRGEAVMELQRFLNAKLNLGLVVDGRLGPKTIAVIKAWQGSHGLVADGLVGPKTKAQMNAEAN